MGLFDGIKKALVGQPQPVRSYEDGTREIILRTDWEIDGDEVIRGFQYRQRTNGREDKLLFAVNVQLSKTGGVVHIVTLRIDPAITRLKQEVRFMMGAVDADVLPATSPAHIGVDDDGSNILMIFDRDGAARVMALLRAAVPMTLRMAMVDGTLYARDVPSDPSFLTVLEKRERQAMGR